MVQSHLGRRCLSTVYSQRPKRVPLPQGLPEQFLSQLPTRMRPENGMCAGHMGEALKPTRLIALVMNSPQTHQGLQPSPFCPQSMQRSRRQGHRNAIGNP